MGPYPNSNKKFGQTMKKSNKSSSAGSRYQRQMGNGKGKGGQLDDSSKLENSKADEAAARRRLRQEQSEIIDGKFGYHRLEDQYAERKNSRGARDSVAIEKSMQRRGWLFNMSATTVRFPLTFTCYY